MRGIDHLFHCIAKGAWSKVGIAQDRHSGQVGKALRPQPLFNLISSIEWHQYSRG